MTRLQVWEVIGDLGTWSLWSNGLSSPTLVFRSSSAVHDTVFMICSRHLKRVTKRADVKLASVNLLWEHMSTAVSLAAVFTSRYDHRTSDAS